MDKKKFIAAADALLASHGFKKKSLTWYRHVNDVTQLLELQKSSYSMLYYVNIAWALDGIQTDGMPTPAEFKCQVRVRLSSLMPNSKTDIESAFDFENVSLNDRDRSELIERTISSCIQLLDDANSSARLAGSVRAGDLRSAAISLEGRLYLGLIS